MKTLQLVIIGLLCYLVKNMPTKDHLNQVIADLEAAVTSEIDQIVAALQAEDVSSEAIARLTALKERVSGIIADAPPPPPPPPVE